MIFALGAVSFSRVIPSAFGTGFIPGGHADLYRAPLEIASALGAGQSEYLSALPRDIQKPFAKSVSPTLAAAKI